MSTLAILHQFLTVCSPPAIESIKQQLDGLSGDCKQVTNTFSSILQVPFLQNLSILNPFKNSSTPSEPTDLNMREVVTRYKDVGTDVSYVHTAELTAAEICRATG